MENKLSKIDIQYVNQTSELNSYLEQKVKVYNEIKSEEMKNEKYEKIYKKYLTYKNLTSELIIEIKEKNKEIMKLKEFIKSNFHNQDQNFVLGQKLKDIKYKFNIPENELKDLDLELLELAKMVQGIEKTKK